MSRHAMPFLVVNYGCEMMYVLGVRLEAQLVEPTKSSRIKKDIVTSMFSPAFMDELFRPQEMYSNTALRRVFTTVSDSSIMRLSENSMKKLYDLMSMSVKYQVLALHHPFELLEYTANHLDALKQVTPADSHGCINDVMERIRALAASLHVGELAQIRQCILNFLLERRIKVSMFLERHIQFADGTFKLENAPCLSPLPVCEAPGTIRFYTDGQQVAATHFAHRDAGLSYPPNVAVGHWGPQHFRSTAPRVTTSGANLYNVGRHPKDQLAVQTHEIPSRKAAVPTTTSPLTPTTPTGTEALQAYQKEMSYLSQLVGTRPQPQEKITLSLFEADDETDLEGDPSAALTPAVPPPPVSPANVPTQAHPSAVAAQSSPVVVGNEMDGSSPAQADASSMVKLYKMDANAVKQENRQLLGIIDGLDGKGAPHAKPDVGGDNLLDIMDDI